MDSFVVSVYLVERKIALIIISHLLMKGELTTYNWADICIKQMDR